MAVPTVEQVRRALDAAPREFRLFLAVCAFAGLRLGEAAGLQVIDVDVPRRRLAVRRQVQGQARAAQEGVAPKAGSERVIAISESLGEMVAEHVAIVGVLGEEGWLFSSDSYLLNRNSASHKWRTIRSQIGMEELTLHDLRHFYASAPIAAGCDVVTVQRALGQSSATITLNTYSHLWPSAEDRTRAAATDLMREVLCDPAPPGSADSLRSGSGGQSGDLRERDESAVVHELCPALG